VVLARSTDGGRSFSNYAWTDEPFEASGVFFGDYSGIAAYGGRVYGIWTEKPVPATEAKEKAEEQDKPEAKSEEKDKAKDKGEESKAAKEAKPQPRGTIVKIGTADFTMIGRSK
jgi:hypothetical protein